MGGNREEEVRGIPRRKRRAWGELTPVKPAIETHTESSTETPIDSEALIVGIEDIDPDLVKSSGAIAVGEEEADRPAKAKMPRPKALLKVIRGVGDMEGGDKGGDREDEVKVITIDEESVEEIFVDQPVLHAPDLEDSVKIEEIAIGEESVEEISKDRPGPHAPQRVVSLELERRARHDHLPDIPTGSLLDIPADPPLKFVWTSFGFLDQQLFLALCLGMR